MSLGSITTEMRDSIAKIKMAVKSPDNDEKHLALIHLDHKLPMFLEGIEYTIAALNATMSMFERAHEGEAADQAYKAGLGVSEWESFMPQEWQILNTALSHLGEHRK